MLEIWSKDRFAPFEVPLWAEREGHRVTSTTRAGWWPFRYYTFRISKGCTQLPAPS